MNVVQIARELKVYSKSDGTVNKFALPVLPQALQNKIISILVFVHEVDSDTRVKISWAHGTAFSLQQGPGDISPWANESSTLLDSGDSTGISTGMLSSPSTTDISRVDILAPAIECLKITAGSGQKKVTVSIWAILKPF